MIISMNLVFIINPMAGKRSPEETAFPAIEAYLKRQSIPYQCYVTKRKGEATDIVHMLGQAGEHTRIFGLGGDGTLNEIAVGAVGFTNLEVGIFPCGSGNDYIRTFGTEEDFFSLQRQLEGESMAVDMIRSPQAIALGLSCMGLDANVAYNMVRFKKLPLVSGSVAYDMALIKVLFGKIGNELTVKIDDDEPVSGNYVFALAGSGQFYGGGYRGAPLAHPGDGLLDFVLVRTPRLVKIPGLIGVYKRGDHVRSEKFNGLLEYRQGRRMEIWAQKPAMATFDGECLKVEHVVFEVIPAAVRFVVPKGCSVLGREENVQKCGDL